MKEEGEWKRKADGGRKGRAGTYDNTCKEGEWMGTNEQVASDGSERCGEGPGITQKDRTKEGERKPKI